VALEAIGMVRENGQHLRNARHRFRGHSFADPDELCDPGEHLTFIFLLCVITSIFLVSGIFFHFYYF
jgi:hypothetical protein